MASSFSNLVKPKPLNFQSLGGTTPKYSSLTPQPLKPQSMNTNPLSLALNSVKTQTPKATPLQSAVGNFNNDVKVQLAQNKAKNVANNLF
jgi:hypothetical protein